QPGPGGRGAAGGRRPRVAGRRRRRRRRGSQDEAPPPPRGGAAVTTTTPAGGAPPPAALDFLPHLPPKTDYGIGCVGAGFIMREVQLGRTRAPASGWWGWPRGRLRTRGRRPPRAASRAPTTRTRSSWPPRLRGTAP